MSESAELEQAKQALMNEPTITVAQTARVCGQSERTIRNAIQAGDIQVLKLGRNIRVLSEPLRKQLGIE